LSKVKNKFIKKAKLVSFGFFIYHLILFVRYYP